MQHSMTFTDDLPPIKDTEHTGSTLSTFQVVAGIAAAASIVLMIADMSAAESFVPVQLRILCLTAVLGTLAVYLTMWSEVRQERRHREALAARRPGACCAEAYVDGLARRPFNFGGYHTD